MKLTDSQRALLKRIRGAEVAKDLVLGEDVLEANNRGDWMVLCDARLTIMGGYFLAETTPAGRAALEEGGDDE